MNTRSCGRWRGRRRSRPSASLPPNRPVPLPSRQRDQVRAAPSAGEVPAWRSRVTRCRCAGRIDEGIVADRDIAPEERELARCAGRVQRGVQESERMSGVLIEIRYYPRPLRGTFAGAADALIPRPTRTGEAGVDPYKVIAVGVIRDIRQSSHAAELPLDVGRQRSALVEGFRKDLTDPAGAGSRQIVVRRCKDRIVPDGFVLVVAGGVRV